MDVFLLSNLCQSVRSFWRQEIDGEIKIINEPFEAFAGTDDVLLIIGPMIFSKTTNTIDLIRHQCKKTGQPLLYMLEYDENKSLLCHWIYVERSLIESFKKSQTHVKPMIDRLTVFSSKFINKIEYIQLASDAKSCVNDHQIPSDILDMIFYHLEQTGFALCPDHSICNNQQYVPNTTQHNHWELSPTKVFLTTGGQRMPAQGDNKAFYQTLDVLKSPRPLKNVIITYPNNITLRFLQKVALESRNINEFEFYLTNFLNSENVANTTEELLTWGRDRYQFCWGSKWTKLKPLWDTRHLFETVPNSFMDVGDFWTQSHILMNYQKASKIYDRWVIFCKNNNIVWTGKPLPC